jgi:hypothetical protein
MKKHTSTKTKIKCSCCGVYKDTEDFGVPTEVSQDAFWDIVEIVRQHFNCSTPAHHHFHVHEDGEEEPCCLRDIASILLDYGILEEAVHK